MLGRFPSNSGSFHYYCNPMFRIGRFWIGRFFSNLGRFWKTCQFCLLSLSKIINFYCLSNRSISFSFKSPSINFSLALKKFLVAPLLRLSSHHPKLAVIISCHTNKTIYVLSCTKVALELLHCCCCCCCCCAVQRHAVPQHAALRCVLWNQYGMENHLR